MSAEVPGIVRGRFEGGVLIHLPKGAPEFGRAPPPESNHLDSNAIEFLTYVTTERNMTMLS